MQTLEVNYKSIFETLPGRNVLLLPDPPTFTVLAVSDSYLMGTPRKRRDAEGRSLFELLSSYVVPELRSIVSRLDQSLGRVVAEKVSDAFEQVVGPLQQGTGHATHLIRFVNKPVLSQDGELVYILHSASDVQYRQAEAPPSCDYDVFSLVDQAPVGMAVLKGPNLVVDMANEYILRVWGKGRRIIGMPIDTALPELRDQHYLHLLRMVYETGQEYSGRQMPAVILRDGVPRRDFFNFTYTPLRVRGKNVGVLIVASDVTSLVESKKLLEESESRYRDLIANATVGTAVYVGPDMRIHLANRSMLRLWNRDISVIGMSLATAIPELRGQPFLRLLDEVYTTGRTHRANEEPAGIMVNGRLITRYFNFTFKALRDSEGKIYGILNMAVDVTNSVTARLKINEAEERWRIALDSAELGTWDYFPGNGVFHCSRRMLEMYGIDPGLQPSFEELLAIVVDEDKERVQDEIKQKVVAGRARDYRVEYRIRRLSDHSLRWLRTQGQVFFNEHGELYRLTGTVFDITERKQVEEALEERVNQRTRELLEANRELARSNHDLEQYAYVASHDLQEPLRKILIYTDLLKEGAVRRNLPDQGRLDKIMASAMRMSHLIQDLLNFSRLLKPEKTFSPVDLNRVIRNVIEDLELKIDETKATIKVEKLPVIEGSEQQLNQLFYNLLNNALKFRKANEGLVINISAGLMSRQAVQSHAELIQSLVYYDIRFQDNGIGFDAKYGAQIFEIFKRLHSRNRYEGTGIGLALCRKITRNHNGDISAESSEGKGSTFHVMLPAQQLHVTRPAPPATST